MWASKGETTGGAGYGIDQGSPIQLPEKPDGLWVSRGKNHVCVHLSKGVTTGGWAHPPRILSQPHYWLG